MNPAFELRHLRYFVAVAEELHFGRAATRLHISQPPLSMQIRALEEALGVQLLIRNQRHVALTKAGEVFLDEARHIVARVNAAAEAARRADRGQMGTLAIGFVSHADYGLLPPLLREFRARAPSVRLTLKESTTDRQIDDLVDGRLDVGFVLTPIEDPRLVSRPIYREPLLAALPEHHPLAQREGPVQLAALADAPFILFPRPLGPGLYDEIVSCCRRVGFSPRVEQEAVQMQTIVSLVSAEIGVALIPASLEHMGRTGVVYKALGDTASSCELALAWRRDDRLATLQLFLETADRVAGALAP
ncbi:MAG: LysR family transcriptional regulator [Burkholderiales bacterium]|nr:LysR family transcriptional regulator [Burkholderiales bacterium]